MAKRKKEATAATSPRPKQKRIEGTFDPIPQPVQLAADQYVEAKREVAAWRERMNGQRDELVAKMKEYDVRELLIDDEEKKLLLVEEDKIKIVARKKVGEDSDES